MIRRFCFLVIFSATLSGCASLQEIDQVLREVRREWKVQNDQLRREMGSRIVQATSGQVYEAALSTVNNLGFSITDQNREKGFVFAVAPAPLPLTDAEWEKVKEIDEPPTKKIAARTLPFSSIFFALHVDRVEVNIVVALLPVDDNNVKVSFDFTTVDHKALDLGLTANEEPSPTAARVGLAKAWKEFETQLNKLKQARQGS